MDATEFEVKTGRPPELDDLERVNCSKAGNFGHFCCGWCDDHDEPMFQCGCQVPQSHESTKVE